MHFKKNSLFNLNENLFLKRPNGTVDDRKLFKKLLILVSLVLAASVEDIRYPFNEILKMENIFYEIL